MNLLNQTKIMTREFIEQLDVVEPYCYKTDREEIWHKVGLVDGLKITDEHPNIESLWHDASEMPNNHNYIMFVIDRYTIKTDYIPACLKHCQLNGSNWNEFAKDVNIKKWAYISDLLPEQFGNSEQLKGGGK